MEIKGKNIKEELKLQRKKKEGKKECLWWVITADEEYKEISADEHK